MALEAEEYPAIVQSTTEIRIVPLAPIQDVLTDLLRDGARRLLTQAIEAEVAAWVDDHAHLKDADGRRQVVRNGPLSQREPSGPASGPSGSSSPGSETAGPPTNGRSSTRPSCRCTCGRPGPWRGCPGCT